MSKGMQKANQVSHCSLYCFSVFSYASMPINKWVSGTSLWMLCGWSGIHNTLWWVQELISRIFQSEMFEWCRFLSWCVSFIFSILHSLNCSLPTNYLGIINDLFNHVELMYLGDARWGICLEVWFSYR